MRWLLWTLLAGFLLWSVASAVTQVQPGERAVVKRLGRILDTTPGPGLYVGLPWGLDQVERVPVARMRRVAVWLSAPSDEEESTTTPPGQLLTGDHNLVNVQAEINYVIAENQAALFALQGDRVDALVARAAETVVAEWIAGRSVDDVLLRGNALLPAELVERVGDRLRDYQLGLQVVQATVNRPYPPKAVKKFFDELSQAEAGVRTQINQAEQKANQARIKADADVHRLERSAAAYTQEQLEAAQADAKAFALRLAEYRKLTAKDPDYLNTLWQDEMTRLYARMRAAGRIDLLDHYLSGEGLTITQFPLLPKKK